MLTFFFGGGTVFVYSPSATASPGLLCKFLFSSRSWAVLSSPCAICLCAFYVLYCWNTLELKDFFFPTKNYSVLQSEVFCISGFYYWIINLNLLGCLGSYWPTAVTGGFICMIVKYFVHCVNGLCCVKCVPLFYVVLRLKLSYRLVTVGGDSRLLGAG